MVTAQEGRQVGTVMAGLGRGIHLFHLFLRLLTGVLALSTVVFAAVAIFLPLGQLDLTLDASVTAPYSVSIPSRGEVRVLEDGSVEESGGSRDEGDLAEGAPVVRSPASVSSGDTDARLAVVGLLGAWLGLAWSGVALLGRVVDTARSGDPFASQNSRRLRWLAGVAWAAPVATTVLGSLVQALADTPYTVDLTPGIVFWVTSAGLGAAVLGLAEVMSVGTKLHEFERSAI
jgi:hypothetical protein